MDITFEELTHTNYREALGIDRGGVSEDFVVDAEELMELTDYGVEHACIGHTFIIKLEGRPAGLILLGEAIPWETDPPQVKREPFYRLMGFIIDASLRSRGVGGEALEKAIGRVYRDFGIRPIVMGCHKDNLRAAAFYEKHGFTPTEYMEGDDIYYLRYPGSNAEDNVSDPNPGTGA